MSKTILVTGANGSLGSVVVKHFLEKNYTVIGIDNSLEKLGVSITNERFIFYGADVADEQLMSKLLQQIISEHGQIHGALLLVGGFAMGSIEATSGKDLQDMFRLNFYSAFHPARILFDHMLSNDYGRLAFIGARPAIVPSQGKNMIAYSLSKSLLFDFAELLNASAKNKNFSASVIVPSVIDTARNRREMPDTNPDNWVKPVYIAELLEMLFSDSGSVLRETVLKVYNKS